MKKKIFKFLHNLSNVGKEGYTLIEVLVVISIISLIMSASMYSFNIARYSASDTHEIVAFDQIRKAQVMYFGEENHYDSGKGYSSCRFNYKAVDDLCVDCSASGPLDFFNGLESKNYFSQQEILDMFGDDSVDPPVNSNYRTCYHYTDDGKYYKIVSILYDQEKMKNDGGVSDNYYEVGNDMNIPIVDNPSYY